MKRFLTFATTASAIQVGRKASTDSGDAASMVEIQTKRPPPGTRAAQPLSATPTGFIQTDRQTDRVSTSFIQTASKRFLHKPIEPDTIVDDVDDADDQATSLVQYAFIFKVT